MPDQKPTRHRSDLIAGMLAALLGAAVALYARTFPPMPGQRIGPALFPTLIGLLLAVLGLALAAIRTRVPAPADATSRPRLRDDAPLRFAAVAGVLVLYVALVDRVGFFLTGFAVLVLLMLLFGVRRTWIAPIAAIVTLAIHYGFYTLLRVPLPWGVLEGFAW